MTHHPLVRLARRRILPLGLALTCLVMPSASHAQDDGQATASKPSPPAAAVSTAETKPRFNDNVKIDVTITDQAANGKPIAKTISTILANRQNASIRTQMQVPVLTSSKKAKATVPPAAGAASEAAWRWEELPLFVDLYAEMSDPTHVRVGLSLKYKTLATASEETELPQALSEVTQQLSVFLDSGKPLVISQSADAATDRKVTIELKATILK